MPVITDSLSSVRVSKEKLDQYYAQFKTQVKAVVKEAKFFDDNEVCPTCDQDIAEELRKSKKDAATAKAKDLKGAMEQAEIQQEKYKEEISGIEEQMSSCLADQNTLRI